METKEQRKRSGTISGQRSAIESDFPFPEISEIAERESWRKEVYRPIYHLHKWWAKRLGSVFRAAIIGAASGKGADVMEQFYEKTQFPDAVVYDPFLGSGTTVGEAHKLGCTAVGKEINQVAYRVVKTALSRLDRSRIQDFYSKVEEEVKTDLLSLYRSSDGRGKECDVLYYFWVKHVPCPSCTQEVELFKSYVFAKHAYPKKHPEVHTICPECKTVFESHYEDEIVECPECENEFDQNDGPARRTRATCPHCRSDFRIIDAAKSREGPPEHRMYAKLVLRDDGKKEYLPITEEDRNLYREAHRRWEDTDFSLPKVELEEGENTNQVINYGYRYWNQFFNSRQLLGLSRLAESISDLPKSPERDVLSCLFSGTLEFNNMFASYKGEGTGAVRHMFSHHVLKPERTPLEANIWGTPKSSGAFSQLYDYRVKRFLDYRESPFELSVEYEDGSKSSRKVYGVNPPIEGGAHELSEVESLEKGEVYLSCGDSRSVDLPDESVDYVVTDPPFFDNVHYSELADFFHVWQNLLFEEDGDVTWTTRQKGEVQDANPEDFSRKLSEVFKECHRVLKDDGLLVFSYHHSREEGWTSVSKSVLDAGFRFVASQPVKSEMSTATPKSQSSEPIDLDVFLVCRKEESLQSSSVDSSEAFSRAREAAREKVRRFNEKGRELSRGDVRGILSSELLVSLSSSAETGKFAQKFEDLLSESDEVVEEMASSQVLSKQSPQKGLFA